MPLNPYGYTLAASEVDAVEQIVLAMANSGALAGYGTNLLAVQTSDVLSANGPMKGVAGDSGFFFGIACLTSSSLVVTVYDGASTAGTPIPGWQNKALVAGNYYPMAPPKDCANGIFFQVVSGSGTVLGNFI
jgi:hypothetical protein